MINIVLYQPEIPQNTGNIIRTCVALGANLHLIKPYGFELNQYETKLARSSTNYLQQVKYYEYEDFSEFITKNENAKLFFLTRYGENIYTEVATEQIDEPYFVFGSESSGIAKEILQEYKNDTFRIPMKEEMRSLNLSNCVAIVAYEWCRKNNFAGLEFSEPHKKDFL